MPSPFPGMDPYLEDPLHWSGVHHRLITVIAHELNSSLPDSYAADIGERLYVVQSGRPIYPDVSVFEQALLREPVATYETNRPMSSYDRPVVLTVTSDEIREAFVEIRTLEPDSRVIAVLEVLSPSNKEAGHPGRELYLTKQQEVLNSDIHLIEIDLLREGSHTVAVPYERLRKQMRWDYLVALHRGAQKAWQWKFEAWAITLRQRLPRICVPLANGDPEVVLDLQSVFDRCYDEGPYRRRINYGSDPPTPLGAEDVEWADALLREKGLRS